MTIALCLLAATAAGATPRGQEPRDRAVVNEVSLPAQAAAKSQPTRGERRCRALAKRRIARLRAAARARGRARVDGGARRRVKRRLRRCLAAARQRASEPALPGTGTPPPQAPTEPGAPVVPGPSQPLPSFVGATASDVDGFRLTLSRPAVAAGNVTIELRNTDSGPHDLVVEPEQGGAAAARFDAVEPGAAPTRKTVALPAGRWRLYCSLPNHALAGMEATLRAE